jgi:hypothetical protein
MLLLVPGTNIEDEKPHPHHPRVPLSGHDDADKQDHRFAMLLQDSCQQAIMTDKNTIEERARQLRNTPSSGNEEQATRT